MSLFLTPLVFVVSLENSFQWSPSESPPLTPGALVWWWNTGNGKYHSATSCSALCCCCCCHGFVLGSFLVGQATWDMIFTRVSWPFCPSPQDKKSQSLFPRSDEASVEQCPSRAGLAHPGQNRTPGLFKSSDIFPSRCQREIFSSLHSKNLMRLLEEWGQRPSSGVFNSAPC